MDMGNGDPATGNAIMGSSIVTLLFIQVLLIALNAVFASAELAVLSVNETKMERLAEQGNKRAKRLYKLTQEPAYFVPETIKADVLFRNMKKIHKGIAVVLDEYGGMAGIVTLNDLIEELVGELQESSAGEGVEQPPIELIEENTWRISGNASLDEIEKELDIKFGADNIYTFTGFVFDKLNGIPEDGEPDIKLECDGISILIKRIKDHQIALAEIRKNRDLNGV